jgi:hypothetical protein
MKTLAITLAFIFGITLTSFATNDSVSKDKKNKKQTELKRNMDREVQKHIFFPQNEKEAMEGSADVMLQVYPDGDVRVILIQTKNPLIQKFIEAQVAKMKVDKDAVVIGQVFRYRFSFRKMD